TYKMWYAAWNDAQGTDAIGYATSTDGITWTKYNDPSTTTNPYANSDPVLTPGSPGAWDEDAVGDPSVIKENGTYHMWFFGEGPGYSERIGYASSTDGINWTKYAGNPVLSEGGTGAFDDSDVWGPMVINDPGNTYKMWYAGEDSSENGSIGYATSQAGPGDELAVSFATGGLWHYDHSGPTWAGIGGPAEALENFQGDLAVDFGTTGLWLYDGAWAALGGNPDAMEACGTALYVDFGATGLWRYDGAWSSIGGNPDDIQCCGTALYVDFGATGLWRYDGSWSALAGNPTDMWCANGVFYANLSGSLWRYDGAWSGVGGAAQGVEGCGSAVYVDYGASGLWRYDGAWSGIGGNPQSIKCCGGTLYVDYDATGLWRYNGAWSGLAGDTEDLCCADALYVDFATGGLWRYDGAWTGLGGDTTVMTDVDINP
ncbi:MAG: hypothetical protein GY836_10905, partial [Herbaspirillum sp.]|uniref:hypothetical protein n=1 Tax=Herbaspirillum sp. TaxID=1890675 RepID=UPI00336F0CA8|nr:hypothetical protein [Herbaspirillum sp.]